MRIQKQSTITFFYWPIYINHMTISVIRHAWKQWDLGCDWLYTLMIMNIINQLFIQVVFKEYFKELNTNLVFAPNVLFI